MDQVIPIDAVVGMLNGPQLKFRGEADRDQLAAGHQGGEDGHGLRTACGFCT